MRRRDFLRTTAWVAGTLPCTGCAGLVDLLRSVLREPQVSLRKMEIASASLDHVTALFHVNVKNPNPIGMRLDGLGYALSLDGARFARGDLDEGLELKAKGSSLVKLPIEFSLGESAQAILAVLDKETLPYALETDFRFRWQRGKISVPVTFDGEMPMPKIPKIEVREFRFTQIGLQGIGVRVTTSVTNPNAFDIPLDRFRFDVKLNNRPILQSQSVAGVRMAARQTRDIPLDFTIGLLDAGLSAASLLERPELRWGVNASVKSGTFEMPFAAAGQVPLR